jgi:hypothetical protein
MRLVTVLAAMIFAFIAATTSTHAQGRGNGQAKKTTVSAPKTKGQTPKQTTKAETRAAKTTAKADRRAAKAEARAAKATAKAETRAARAETRAAKAETRAAKTEARVANTTAKPEGRGGQPEARAGQTEGFVAPNPNLEARLLAMLPAGSTIQDASQGFRNWGQFVAAVNTSNNLNIPFADLKAKMTGPTPMSLGQAIQSFQGTTTAPQP